MSVDVHSEILACLSLVPNKGVGFSLSEPIKLRWRRPRLVLLILLCSFLGLAACHPDGRRDDPRIVSVEPSPLERSLDVDVIGYGFGETEGRASISGYPCLIRSWTSTLLRVSVPVGLPPGHWRLIIHTTDGDTLTAPVEIQDPGGLEPSGPNAGPPAVPSVSEDEQPPPPPLVARFLPDAQEQDAVRLRQAQDGPESLMLIVDLAGLPEMPRGVAFHLRYDPNLIAFEQWEERPEDDTVFHMLEPGRVAFGWRRPVGSAKSLRIRFGLIGPGEGRIEFPKSYRSLRDDENTALPGLRWSSGSVRVSQGAR